MVSVEDVKKADEVWHGERKQLEEFQKQVIRRVEQALLSKIARQLRERADSLKTRSSYMAKDNKGQFTPLVKPTACVRLP